MPCHTMPMPCFYCHCFSLTIVFLVIPTIQPNASCYHIPHNASFQSQHLVAVGLLALELSPCPDSFGELLKSVHGGVPVNASVGDGDTPLEVGRALLRDLLVASTQVALNHDTDDAVLTLADLVADDLGNLGLVVVVLERVAVRAVDHHDRTLALGLEGLASGSDAVLVEVGALGATTENDEAVGVAGSLGDSGETLLGHTHEVVLGSGRANGVNSDSEATVGTVLEAHGERETGSKLTVELGLGGASANGSKGDEVCEELRRDGVEHLRGNGHALGGEVAVELAGDTETLVDLVRLIDIRVVDQTLPANSCARLFKVGAHDDAEIALELLGELDEARAVLDSGLGVVHGAGTADDEKTVIALLDDLNGLFAALENGRDGICGSGDLRCEELRLDERVLTEDCRGRVLLAQSVVVEERRERKQHTPRVVDDFVDVDTHCVWMCVRMRVWRDVKRCMGLDAFVDE